MPREMIIPDSPPGDFVHQEIKIPDGPPGGLLPEVGSYLRWALTRGGLLPEVGSYLRWALT